MAFSQETVLQAWKRSGGKCECGRSGHSHYGTCGKQLIWENRGRQGNGAWEAHHRTSVESGGPDSPANCEILCWDCHSRTL